MQIDENSFITSETLHNFTKDVIYDNIKSHRKPEFHPLFRRYIFRKMIDGGEGQTDPPPYILGFRSGNKIFFVCLIFSTYIALKNKIT